MRPIIAAVAVLFTAGCHSQPAPAAAEPARSIVVVVAARDLPAGTVLAEADVRSERWLPENAEGRHTSSVRDVVGLQLAEALSEGELVLVGSGPRRTIEIRRGTTGDSPLPGRDTVPPPLP
jgi:flagella basal body P-ring formation protein FlgA